MRKYAWYTAFGSALIFASVVLYLIHYEIFEDAHHIYIYMLGDLAFLPLEVLLVTLILDRLLASRERRIAMKKIFMVIGAFFSEVGTELLSRLASFDASIDEKSMEFHVTGSWKDEDYAGLKKRLAAMQFSLDSRRCDLAGLRDFLVAKRDFMVRLIENPMLLEHESFTDMLWAVFHLTEELERRRSLKGLSEADHDHLSVDLQRVYEQSILQWLGYMEHLEDNYPYLFSLALRMNPFEKGSCAEISG